MSKNERVERLALTLRIEILAQVPRKIKGAANEGKVNLSQNNMRKAAAEHVSHIFQEVYPNRQMNCCDSDRNAVH